MGSRGVLYFVWGELDNLLQRSIASLEKSNPGLPHHIVRLPDNSTYLDKAAMCEASPFDVTAFLDADTVIFGNLDYGFDRAEKFGVACCVNESPWLRRYEGCKDSGDAVEYNAGVVFFDKVKSKPFFDAWTACVRELDSSSVFMTMAGKRRQGCNDQASMGKAFEDTGTNPFILPLNWNLRPTWQRSYVGPIKIWHDYSDPPDALIEQSAGDEQGRMFQTVYMNDPVPEQEAKVEVNPAAPKVKVRWVMSVPRLGFQDNFFCGSAITARYGINPSHYCGAFWGQCLQRTMNDSLGADWIFSTDFDSVFTLEDFEKLSSLMARMPDADAIAGVQLRRLDHAVLGGIRGKRQPGEPSKGFTLENFASDLLKVDVAHFGFTMFRVSALKKMAKPWFLNVPNKDGEWEDGKIDEDIYFWNKWRATGNSLYLASHVPVGHIEALITWPDKEMGAIHQAPSNFWKDGKPENVWT